eukprot:1158150-Pelagomonas_calceolata.AAC.7
MAKSTVDKGRKACMHLFCFANVLPSFYLLNSLKHLLFQNFSASLDFQTSAHNPPLHPTALHRNTHQLWRWIRMGPVMQASLLRLPNSYVSFHHQLGQLGLQLTPSGYQWSGGAVNFGTEDVSPHIMPGLLSFQLSCAFHGHKELFTSDHEDVIHKNTILGKCNVHTLRNYESLQRISDNDYFARFSYKAALAQLLQAHLRSLIK